MVTGRDAEKSGQGDFESLQEKLSDGPVAVGTENNDVGERGWKFWESEIDSDDIVPNHAYIVEEIIPADDPRNTRGEPVVVLTNPWGPDGVARCQGGDPQGGQPQGVATARLLLRHDEQRRKVDLTRENPVDLFGRSMLELVEVHRPAEGELSASVTVRISD